MVFSLVHVGCVSMGHLSRVFADKSKGNADVRSLAEHLHTVRIVKGDSSTDDTEREL